MAIYYLTLYTCWNYFIYRFSIVWMKNHSFPFPISVYIVPGRVYTMRFCFVLLIQRIQCEQNNSIVFCNTAEFLNCYSSISFAYVIQNITRYNAVKLTICVSFSSAVKEALSNSICEISIA